MNGKQLQFGDDERTVALRKAWERVLHTLVARVNKVTYESYIRPIRPLCFERQEVTLGVASPFAREWLDKRYSAMIRDALESALGCPVSLRFSLLAAEHAAAAASDSLDAAHAVVESEPGDRRQADRRQAVRLRLDSDADAAGAPLPAARSRSATGICSLPLNDRYTFENFIVGKSNRLAQASAFAVAHTPGTVYNPLFLYGGPGLGKTHVLHSIGHAALAAHPRARVALIDGESFTYQFVTALRERKTEEFRKHFRGVDVWLVDDIQFIAGKEQTKEEFFHTFNALYQTGKQIVLASDRSPRELRTLDERLRSRFECGLVADIMSPELETRMAILDRRCEIEQWDVPQEVTYYIASMICSNIRALEGALTRLIAYSSIMHSPISIDLAQSVLGEYLIDKPLPESVRKGISTETILAAAAEQFQTTVEAIRSPRRDRPALLARQAAMHLCRELNGAGLAQIGASIGGRDHTTVQRGIARLEQLLKSDPALRQTLEAVRAKLDR